MCYLFVYTWQFISGPPLTKNNICGTNSNHLVSAVTLAFSAADQTRAMQDQMSGSAMMAPPDPMKAFKAEWEALEICSHDWALEGVEEELTGGIVQPETIYIKNKFA